VKESSPSLQFSFIYLWIVFFLCSSFFANSVTGKDRVRFLERLVVADVASLAQGQATLSLFTNQNGGIIDDTIIANKGDHISVVVNAGCFDKVCALIPFE
jgi:aminomethyltransferase